ncbi:hypothetical protein N8873_01665 [Flavobacteriaceae bacterium]|jgi:hypothetical protein|nr:hypothetical protein [Flavobacteriaceae bacterium]MDA7710754.1 hypothetical protein [Flavobacteriaceae bacterium]MDA8969884.1 hypothetical protein [bacterium]MDA8993243.1 hypothetical protein [Flavobacteriaceae bacterium]MDB4307103.1 hypothetical protein [Flavobacteriaceae bacterium]
MYALLKPIHSFFAYLVLITLVLALLNAIRGIFAKKEFGATDLRLSLFALIFSHLQLVIGLILYFVSPWFDQWSALGMKGVMGDASARLYLVEHPSMNLLALILITMGWSLHKRQTTSGKKFSRIGIFYGLGLLFLLSRIPWSSWI